MSARPLPWEKVREMVETAWRQGALWGRVALAHVRLDVGWEGSQVCANLDAEEAGYHAHLPAGGDNRFRAPDMDQRDQFALTILNSLIRSELHLGLAADVLARMAYEQADAMMTVRQKR